MKKLFTIVALLACVMGAKAANWVEIWSIDYSGNTGFPYYVMGYVPEWVGGVMTDYGSDYRYATQDVLDNGDAQGNGKLEDGESIVGSTTTQGGVEYQKVTGKNPYWHQYFIADNIPTQIDGSYKIVAMVKASEECTINVNMGWGWGGGEQASASVAISTTWTEVEWEYSGIGGASCNLVAQPGTVAATLEWKYLKVYENQKPQAPTIWQEWLTSDGQPAIVETTSDAIPTYMGNAETPWADPNVRFNDQTKNYLICAWSKEKGRNMNDNGGWDPFPADIENVDGSNVFVCHGKLADSPDSADGQQVSAWDNQFWIESPREWQSGEQLKIHFRYKCSAPSVKTNTQIHHQNPSDYLIWHAIGDITFTDQWQVFDGTMTMGDDMAGGWSIAFNLNPEVKDPVNFYLDDLCWQSMKLDEGYFIAGCNTKTGLDYDFANAVEFVGDDMLVAVIGEDEWVNQVMISTVRGNDTAFKSHTLKPAAGDVIESGDGDWYDYEASSLAKLNLALAGKWEVTIAPDYKMMQFVMLEGEEAGISKVVFDFTNGTRTFYNLAGQRVSEDYKGVVIQNGKKVIKK